MTLFKSSQSCFLNSSSVCDNIHLSTSVNGKGESAIDGGISPMACERDRGLLHRTTLLARLILQTLLSRLLSESWEAGLWWGKCIKVTKGRRCDAVCNHAAANVEAAYVSLESHPLDPECIHNKRVLVILLLNVSIVAEQLYPAINKHLISVPTSKFLTRLWKVANL